MQVKREPGSNCAALDTSMGYSIHFGGAPEATEAAEAAADAHLASLGAGAVAVVQARAPLSCR